MELINGLTEDTQKQIRNQIITIYTITANFNFSFDILKLISYFNLLKFILFNN